LAGSLSPNPGEHRGSPIIDATPIPVHHRDHRQRSTTPCGHGRPPLAPNRNAVVVARATVAHLLTGEHDILGDGGDRGINTISTPRRDCTGRIIRDHHRRIRSRVEHVIARLKDWQILRQSRRRGDAINHSLQIVAGPWNLKTRNQLRVNS
jgi:hypothetical protein